MMGLLHFAVTQPESLDGSYLVFAMYLISVIRFYHMPTIDLP